LLPALGAALLLAGCQSATPMETVPHVDLPRFMGPWYVIANIPTFVEKGAHNAVETYKLDADGTIATTFKHWREKLFANIESVRALGYPDEFIRMWEFYFCYCEGGFAERAIGDVQMLLVKPLARP
jgi:hypothetical protein